MGGRGEEEREEEEAKHGLDFCVIIQVFTIIILL